jgi:hypothetical protein
VILTEAVADGMATEADAIEGESEGESESESESELTVSCSELRAANGGRAECGSAWHSPQAIARARLIYHQ